MFRKVLIANRGAIACRILRTLDRMGIAGVAVYSEADRHSMHVELASEAVAIGPAPAKDSYLVIDRIIDAARRTGAEAVHPGYGFLSENPEFAEACEQAGLVFLGPTPEQMRDFGLKHTARSIAEREGVPLLPGSGLLENIEDARAALDRVGVPAMLKSTAGGGGIGMRLIRSVAELDDAFEAVERLGKANFKQGGSFLERFVERARHIEVQIFGDGAGHIVALGERDCSAQRRNQKVIEETPAPGLSAATRERLLAAAVQLGRAVQYRSAGTVEFIYDDTSGDFYFLEVNTRLQVEHGVTEEVTGVDLVEWMIRLGAGEWSPQPVKAAGASIQVRIYAEDPLKNFQPSSGTLTHVEWPRDARVDGWVASGAEVTPYYDPLLAKVIVKGADRTEAAAKLGAALNAASVAGVSTNLQYLRHVVADPRFQTGGITTSFLGSFAYAPRAIEVLDGGTQTTVQDWPGRIGFWAVGVPPSGPIDSLAFRTANKLVGNPEGTAALECTVTGPTLRFHADTIVAVTGADMGVERGRVLKMTAGSELRLGSIQGAGARTYVAVAGGFDVPEYLGSRATFILGKFGGHGGRALRAGDVLAIGATVGAPCEADPIPSYSSAWEIGAAYGPHGAPDFFRASDIETFFAADWRVHHNSDRTGIRLIGQKPEWARADGGEAGLHPSNIHDNAYAIGTIDFTGDMPIILGPDGPSLGGFVCPATIVQDELWKIGQLRPGDTVRFRRVDAAEPVIRSRGDIVCRQSGDAYLLIEFGPLVLDFELRFRAHAIYEWFDREPIRGIIDLTPGIRSLQIHYDPKVLPRTALLDLLDQATREAPSLDTFEIPSRIVHLPLSWDDPATRLAIDKYVQSVRPDAPWCFDLEGKRSNNIEFIRRINGLKSVDDVHRIVFDASYLTLGLGDVYLGAPVAVPVDPRHRLVTTKYNPARTWTAENSVGIGGAYLCVYGMEGPGGYQFVGRTIQMWNTYRQTREFRERWLLRFFDQIRFHPVTADELLEMRDAFPYGKYSPRIEESSFRLRDYREFLSSIQPEAEAFQRHRQAAFEAERDRWGDYIAPPEVDSAPPSDFEIPEGHRAVVSPVTASVWSIGVEEGQHVLAGERLLVLEAMKMEVAVMAGEAGTITGLLCKPGAMVAAGQAVAILRPHA